MTGLGSGSQDYWGANGPPRPGRIEYRLIRESILREYRKGRLGRTEVCDAQPELLRVARNLGRQTEMPCPICEEAKVVHVSFAFGPHLPPSGRALGPGDLGRLAHRGTEVACYVVEVCIECSWNHLLRMFPFETSRGKRARA